MRKEFFVPASTVSSSITGLLIVCLAMQISCGRVNAREAAPDAATASQDVNEKQGKKDDKDVQELEVRNNAASLLAGLLGEEKNVGKLLILKHGSPQTE